MPTAVAEQLQQEMNCDGLLECIHGLKDLDKRCYRQLIQSRDALTIDEIADRIDRERSTAYRSVQRLQDAGLLHEEQENYEQGGYRYRYSPITPSEVAGDMQRLLNDWYAKMGQLIKDFEEEYQSYYDSEEAITGST